MPDVTPLRIATTDGWQLRLLRLEPQQRRFAHPVLLIHGFGANSFVMFHEPGPTVGGYLCDQGFLVYCLDFRGTRTSRHPEARRAFARICVDDKIDRDLPAAIEAALGDSGARALDVVGHSLGGTILYAYLACHGDEQVRRCAAIASPIRFRLPLAAQAAARLSSRPLLGAAIPKRIPMRRFCELGLATNLVFPARPNFNMSNVERGMLLRMMEHGVDDNSMCEVRQLAQWARSGGFGSLDGARDYRRGLGQVRAAMLLLGAAADRHVPAGALERVAALLGSRDKRLRIIGEAGGACCDYGHTDLLLGRQAHLDVFPLLRDWLATGA